MIPKRHRGISSQQIRILFRSCRKSNLGGWTAWWRRKSGGQARLAVLVSKRAARRATVRVKIRRRIQAATLPFLLAAKDPIDLVISWNEKDSLPSPKRLRDGLKRIFQTPAS